jgi:MraZ protein
MRWDKNSFRKNMLLGEYKHTLDDKNRVSLPAKARKILGKKIIITRGLDRCLMVYSLAEWKKFSDALSELPFNQSDSRAFTRFMVSGAEELDIDSAGRILIPDFLKQYGNLGSKIIVAGVRNRLELWNEDAWSAYTKKVEQNVETLAEGLTQLGIM